MITLTKLTNALEKLLSKRGVVNEKIKEMAKKLRECITTVKKEIERADEILKKVTDN